ncbi:hypothetical protein C0989_006053 [Termitomyces sp. Mn162]|nr:hypothetical protein C0989_006053 [Termitomyces sp. Mn162]
MPTSATTTPLLTWLNPADTSLLPSLTTIPRGIIPANLLHVTPRLLRSFNVTDRNVDINEDGWANVKNALLHPHCNAIRNQAHSKSCKVEKKFNKHCLEEAKSESFKPISASGPSKKGRGVNRSNNLANIQQTTLPK